MRGPISCVYVHGFQTSFDDALAVTAQVAHNLTVQAALQDDLRLLPLVPIAFTWPSDGVLKAYWSDAEDAAMSGVGLSRFIARSSAFVADRARAAALRHAKAKRPGPPPRPVRIHLMVQSMGHQVLAAALAWRQKAETPAGWLLDTVLSTAADIEKSAFAEGGTLRPLLDPRPPCRRLQQRGRWRAWRERRGQSQRSKAWLRRA